MSSYKDITCGNCGAVNPHDYLYCFCCRVVPGAKVSSPKAAASARKKWAVITTSKKRASRAKK